MTYTVEILTGDASGLQPEERTPVRRLWPTYLSIATAEFAGKAHLRVSGQQIGSSTFRVLDKDGNVVGRGGPSSFPCSKRLEIVETKPAPLCQPVGDKIPALDPKPEGLHEQGSPEGSTQHQPPDVVAPDVSHEPIKVLALLEHLAGLETGVEAATDEPNAILDICDLCSRPLYRLQDLGHANTILTMFCSCRLRMVNLMSNPETAVTAAHRIEENYRLRLRPDSEYKPRRIALEPSERSPLSPAFDYSRLQGGYSEWRRRRLDEIAAKDSVCRRVVLTGDFATAPVVENARFPVAEASADRGSRLNAPTSLATTLDNGSELSALGSRSLDAEIRNLKREMSDLRAGQMSARAESFEILDVMHGILGHFAERLQRVEMAIS